MAPFDVVIRNGLVVDGTGAPAFKADVGIKDGLITAVAPNLPTGTTEIDALHKIVTPGFVDIHTHYDAQVIWDSLLNPSSLHGVTTALMGNCGVGFAPVRKEHAGKLMELMEGVEDIPEAVLADGLDFSCELRETRGLSSRLFTGEKIESRARHRAFTRDVYRNTA
jgi:N-acyl-D-aspartate/D-glutamate deacylase